MNKMIVGFIVGIMFTCLCGFSTGYYGSRNIRGSYKPDLNDIVYNQKIIAKMIEAAKCKD
jgi:hypothetical protein